MKHIGKPWISSGIIKSIKAKNKLHNKFLKEANKEVKIKLHNEFKKKRNLLNKIICEAKKQYYRNFFEQNRKDIKKHGQKLKKLLTLTNHLAPFRHV